MYYVLMANFHHETNTFSNVYTGVKEYKDRAYAIGDDIIRKYAGTLSEVGGFIHEIDKYDDIELIPAIMADAQPSGPVTADMYARVCNEITKTLEKCPRIDGVLLSLHGAMVTENSYDGEGDFLSMIRTAVGADVPIITTFDLHSILTEKKCSNCDVIINYDEYPHTDMFERGSEAAKIMADMLHGRIKPTMSCKHIPMIIPSISSSHPVIKKYLDMAHAFETNKKVLTVSLSYGFHFADVPELGMTVVAVTDDDEELAAEITKEIGNGLWKERAGFISEFYSLNEAISILKNCHDGPIVIADVTDNPGGGASCDGTAILAALIENNIENTIVAHICDRKSLEDCYEAGIGKIAHLHLGGKRCPQEIGGPVECDAYVKCLTDGKYTNIDIINGGYPITLGKTALVTIAGVAVIITDCIEQPFDRGMLYSHGIDPTRMNCIVLKSTVHFRAAYESIAKMILPVHIDGGLMAQDLKQIPYKNVIRPKYPLDDM